MYVFYKEKRSMCDFKNNSGALSNDELWAKAAQSGPISREELGIDNDSSSNGITYLHEGTQGLTFEMNSNDETKTEE